MSEHKTYPVPEDTAQGAIINAERYKTMYAASLHEPGAFCTEQANSFLSWRKPWHTLTSSDLSKGEAAWFVGGQLNACYNCVDRHLP